MTLTELRYIVTLAQERHVGRAAKRHWFRDPVLQAFAYLQRFTDTDSSSALDSNALLAIRPYAGPIPERHIVLGWRVSFPGMAAIDILNRANRHTRFSQHTQQSQLLQHTQHTHQTQLQRAS